MLVPPRQEAPLQQGDIIRDVPFLVMPEELNVKAHEIQGQKHINSADAASIDRLKEFAQGKAFAAASMPLILRPGIVITQGCDLQHKDSITIARVYPIEQLVVRTGKPLSVARNLRCMTWSVGSLRGTIPPTLSISVH